MNNLVTNEYEIPNPYVIEHTARGEIKWDIYSRLMADRIIFLGSPVNEAAANRISAQLLFLQMNDPKKDIHLYINSPGGNVKDGFAIYDTMQFVACDVNTYCIGLAASMGSFLLAAGTKGKRFALPNSEIMIHQVLGGTGGQASDIEIHARHILRTKTRLNTLLAKHTGQPYDVVEKACDRDNYMTAEEAKAFGLVDEVVVSRKIPGLPVKSSVPTA